VHLLRHPLPAPHRRMSLGDVVEAVVTALAGATSGAGLSPHE
jgi:hypothetical protein